MWANDLIISYSWWSLALVIFTGLLYAAVLYVGNKKNKLSKSLTVTLFIFRFLAVGLMAFLLLTPYIKTRVKSIEKPIILVGIDNSSSIIGTSDSVYYKTQFQEDLQQQLEALSDKYDVKTYLFGQQVINSEQPRFTDAKSDYGAFFNLINSAWSDANTGMIILAGDGLFNSGYDPMTVVQKLNIPMVAIALGDTTEKMDASIKEVRMNATAFLNDMVPLEITYEAQQLKNKSLQLTVNGFGKTLHQETIQVKTDKQVSTIRILLEAKVAGKHRIQVSVATSEKETNLSNNNQNVYLNVLETKQKILVLAFAPHPDIAAISQSLKGIKNYEVTTDYVNTFTGNPANFDLVILHQLPAKKNLAIRIFNLLKEANTPTLLLLGNQSDLGAFNQQFPAVSIRSVSNSKEEALAQFNPAFDLFTYAADQRDIISQLPPLTVPLGTYQTNPGAEVFIKQQIQGFDSDYPLVLFYQGPDSKTAAVLGEGLWRWRIHNYILTQSFDAFDTFLQKTTQYLIANNQQKPFQVFAQDEYNLFDPIELRAECLNASMEMVNTEEIPLTLTNENGENFQYVFSKSNQGYVLRLGVLPEGIYRYTSTANCQGKELTETGTFVVTGIDLENRNTKANHRLLYQLTALNGGRVIYPNQTQLLPDIVASMNLKSRLDYETKLTELGTLPVVMLLIILLLSLEWFLRKYFGTY